MKVVVIIPTYNEAENIGNLIDQLQEVFRKISDWQMEILVVDDSSPDGTGKIVLQKAKKYKGIHLFINKQKKGLGAAYIKGMEYAMAKLKADFVFEFDADGSHNPKYIPAMLGEISKGADVVIGSRYIPGGSIPKNWGLNRKIVSYFGNLMARLVLLTFQYHDMTSGFRVASTKFLKKVDLPNLLSKQYAYKIHLYFALHKVGAKIVEYPIEFIDRAKGKSKFPKNNVLDSLRVIFTLRLRESEKFLKVCIVGIIGLIIQLTIFNILRLTIENPFKEVAVINFVIILPIHTIISVEIAVISNFLINNFWTFKEKKITSPIKMLLKFVQFNLVSLGSIAIQSVVLVTGIRFLGSSFLIDNSLTLLGILLGLIWNYTMYTKLIWKKKN